MFDINNIGNSVNYFYRCDERQIYVTDKSIIFKMEIFKGDMTIYIIKIFKIFLGNGSKAR